MVRSTTSTDARGVVSTYAYDNVNRVTQVPRSMGSDSIDPRAATTTSPTG